MKKLILFLLVLGVTPAVWGQNLGKTVPALLHMEGQVARQVMRASAEAQQASRQAVAAVSAATPAVSAVASSALPRNSFLSYFHNSESDVQPSATPKERPPIWALRGGGTSAGGDNLRKRSRNELLMELSELGILPQGWQEYTREGLQEFLDTYLALKSSGSTPSRFKVMQEDGTLSSGTDAELKAWAAQQPDFVPGNYVYGQYDEPFNPNVKSLRVLIVNDGKEALEPLFEVAEKNYRVELFWQSNPVQAIQTLKQNPQAYDVVLTDYCMRNGTACTLGMAAYANKLPVPIILYSRAGATEAWLFQYNIMGQIDIAVTNWDAVRVFNYLSNIVATGKAYPDK